MKIAGMSIRRQGSWLASAALGASLMLATPAMARSIDPSALPATGRVDPMFQSYNVEMAEIVGGRFWAPYPRPGEDAQPENTLASGGLDLEARLFRQRPPADLADRRLRAMARALGPAYIRVSGSWANAVWFQDDDRPKQAKPPAGFQNVLTRAQWRGVVDFARAVDGVIVTSFAVSAGARDEAGVWKPDEARKLLRYTRELGGRIHAAELMNEPNLGPTSGLPAGYDAAAFARDVAAFREFVRREAPSLLTVGPGSTGETGVALFAGSGIPTEAMMSARPNPRFDIFAYHFYGGRSERCARMAPQSAILPENALSSEWLARTDRALAFYRDLRDRHMPGAPIWLNETAQASCGGDRWAASFLDTFRYVDQMGRLARQDVAAVFHNTLSASDYALIDEHTMTPRPSYWAAVLWRRLMGETVLDAGRNRDSLHIYAHCLRASQGGVGMVAINLDRTRPASLDLTASAHRFTLTADDLQGQSVRLNGRTLKMKGSKLPVMAGKTQRAGRVSLPPASISFFAVSGAANPACR